jgi:hypothetical protein
MLRLGAVVNNRTNGPRHDVGARIMHGMHATCAFPTSAAREADITSRWWVSEGGRWSVGQLRRTKTINSPATASYQPLCSISMTSTRLISMALPGSGAVQCSGLLALARYTQVPARGGGK